MKTRMTALLLISTFLPVSQVFAVDSYDLKHPISATKAAWHCRGSQRKILTEAECRKVGGHWEQAKAKARHESNKFQRKMGKTEQKLKDSY